MGLSSLSSMTLRGVCIVGALELLCVLYLIHGALAQSSSCGLAILEPCLPYLQEGNTTMPGSDCCTPLRSLFTTNPTCICQVAPLAKQTGYSVNETRALEVTKLCHQTIPASVTACLSSGASTPSASPTTPSSTSPPPQSGNGNHGSALLPPSLLFISGSIFVALFMHLGVMST